MNNERRRFLNQFIETVNASGTIRRGLQYCGPRREAASKSSSRHAARAEGKAKSTILDSNDSAYSP